MKRQTTLLAVMALLLVAWVLVPRHQPTAAAEDAVEQQAAPRQLQVVAYSSGLTGFFDPSTNKLYVYASDLKTPFMTVQVEKLGEPLKILHAPQLPQPQPQ